MYRICYNNYINWLFFLLAILFSAGIVISIKEYNYSDILVFWCLGILIGVILYKSLSIFMDLSLLCFICLIFKGHFEHNQILLHLPLISSILIITGYKINSKLPSVLTFLATIIILALSGLSIEKLDFWNYFFLITSILSALIYIIDSFNKNGVIPRKIDFILCSYSGNTGHYANCFIEEAKKTGSRS